MNVDINLTKTLAESAVYLNVTGGGVVAPESSVGKRKDHYLYQLHLPSVGADRLSVQIEGNHLLVFHNILSDEKMIPHLIHNLQLPVDVDVTKIQAEYSEDILSVYLPFNELEGGYRRAVDILEL